MKVLSRNISIRIIWLIAFAAILMASAALTATAVAQDKSKAYPESLQKWVDGGKYLKFEGLDIFVHTSGEDPVQGHGVLVVHGYPGSSWDFADVASKVQKKTKIVIPDMIGFGQSDTPLKGTFKDNFSLLRQADLFEAVAAAEGFKTVILVAHDMGQTVGLELMARQEEGKLPFRIKHAILLNGSTIVDLIETTPGQKASLKLPDRALAEDPPKEEWYKDLTPTYGAKMQGKDGAVKKALDCQIAQIYANDGARVMSNKILIYCKESPQTDIQKKYLKRESNQIVGQGFHQFILANLDALMQGDVVTAKLVLPAHMDQFDIRILKNKIEDGRLQIRIELDNWFLRLFTPSVEAEYDLDTRRLISYRGFSLIADGSGKNLPVTVFYDYSQQSPLASN